MTFDRRLDQVRCRCFESGLCEGRSFVILELRGNQRKKVNAEEMKERERNNEKSKDERE